MEYTSLHFKLLKKYSLENKFPLTLESEGAGGRESNIDGLPPICASTGDRTVDRRDLVLLADA